MHDPMTQAFVIPYGWRTENFKNGTKWRYWKPFITIWHVDPERRGNDDSCGWFRPPLTRRQREILHQLAGDEAREPWFMSLSAKSNRNPIECEAYVRGAFLVVSRCLENSGYRRGVTLEEATKWASIMVHNPTDNFRSSLAFLSGYHSNWYRDGEPNSVEEDKFFREREAESFFAAIMGYILSERRHWWQHPKWHVIHWKRRLDHNRPKNTQLSELRDGEPAFEYKYWGIPLPIVGWSLQIHVLQSFKRWAFSRCCKCGKRFAWGYSPCSNSWNGTGPRWFRSEPDVFHSNCDAPASECIAAMDQSQGGTA